MISFLRIQLLIPRSKKLGGIFQFAQQMLTLLFILLLHANKFVLTIS
jgi:hypothetical protein